MDVAKDAELVQQMGEYGALMRRARVRESVPEMVRIPVQRVRVMVSWPNLGTACQDHIDRSKKACDAT